MEMQEKIDKLVEAMDDLGNMLSVHFCPHELGTAEDAYKETPQETEKIWLEYFDKWREGVMQLHSDPDGTQEVDTQRTD